jgi:Tfp pilus assembly protein PilV
VRRPDAGFSLIEIAIAAGVFVVLALGAFEAVRLLAQGVPQLRARSSAYASLERLGAQLRAEARSASAIWTSSLSAGTAADGCVQLDFYGGDAAGPAFWSYRAFPNHAASGAVPGDALFRAAGTAPIAACDAAHPGDVALRGLRAAPQLAAIPPQQLAAHQDPYLALADSPFLAATIPATAPVALGVAGPSGTPVAGGNATIELRLDTAAASRVVDLVAGTFPGSFTAVLHYTCTERCDVGHDDGTAKTLTTCAIGWQTAWSQRVTWNDFSSNPDGSLSAPSGWFIAGTFVFTYSGTRADGGTDTLVRTAAATNWDAARDYGTSPPDRNAPDGSLAGSFAPWDVRSEPGAAWYADFLPYVASGERAALAAEKQRCDAVAAQGTAGGFYANG